MEKENHQQLQKLNQLKLVFLYVMIFIYRNCKAFMQMKKSIW